MKKGTYYKLLYTISLLLFISFIIILLIDYLNYNAITTSAPFRTYIIIRAIEFILPSIIILIIGKILKKKNK